MGRPATMRTVMLGGERSFFLTSPPCAVDKRPAVEAVLGPTNTGKTHLAVERMLAHRSGMIGLPLRLLAREVYDRVAGEVGEDAVALVTGEEKKIPSAPRFHVCTVESMPWKKNVDFIAVDEVQLAEHDERGHVFTDRILRARGRIETLFLGSSTIEGLLRRLVPEVAVQTRPRLSTLRYAGARKLHQLPPRSAVVAFSAADVYEIAERLRRRHGGAAVVLGALSPRARNAQVALYQSHEVHYIVATDAIGMGLNMDVDHVALASLRKFDGRKFRDLHVAELAQIAGRAGRFRSDGTFGPMSPLAPLPDELVAALESHSFPPLTQMRYRESRLDFTTVADLRATLAAPSAHPFLKTQRHADDERALRELLERPAIRAQTGDEGDVRLLWEVCGIPDFAGGMSLEHLHLLAELFTQLRGPGGEVPAGWIGRRIERIDDPEGDCGILMDRMAAIRTWTYIAHRPGWVSDPRGWQERARDVEDRLSDALHERLTQRFVDRRASILLAKKPRGERCELTVGEGGRVEADGIHVGELKGLAFEALEGIGPSVRALVERGLRPHIEARIDALENAERSAFRIDRFAWIHWEGAPVGRLVKGEAPLRPSAEAVESEELDGAMRDRVRRRLRTLAIDHVAELFASLSRPAAESLGAAGRGLCYRLREGLGFARRKELKELIGSLTEQDRWNLSRLDIRIGAKYVFIRSLLKPASMQARAALWAVAQGLEDPPEVSDDSPPSLPLAALTPPAFAGALGYAQAGPRWIRVDVLERVAALLRRQRKAGQFALPEEIPSWLGCDRSAAIGVLKSLGYALGDDDRFDLCLPPSRKKPQFGSKRREVERGGLGTR